MISTKCIVPLRAGIYLLKVSSRNTGTLCEICWKLSVKTPERRHSGLFIFVNLKHILYIVRSVFIVSFEAGPQLWNPRGFWAWFSVYMRDWLKHWFLSEKDLRNQMLWLGWISKMNCSKKNEMGKRSKYFL